MSVGTQRANGLTNVVTEQAESGEDLLSRVLAATEKVQRKQYSVEEMELMAKKAAASRMFGSGEDGQALMTEDQAFMLMMIAEATNIHPVLALLRWELVKGKPAMKSAYVLAEYQRLGGNVDWVVTTGSRVQATFTCKKHPKPFAVELSLQELMDRRIATFWNHKAGKWEMKYNYVNHPRSMLRWRAVSEGVRATDPGILMGMYTEVEADDTPDPDAGAPPPETEKARAGLLAKLDKRHETARAAHTPVAEVVAEMKAHEEAQGPPPSLKSDCRQWIEDTLIEFNKELQAAAPGEKSVTSYQVANAILSAAIAAGWTKEADIANQAGKRDTRLAAKEVNRLWDADTGAVMAAVGAYLGSKMPQPAAVASDDDDIPDTITDDFPTKAE